MLFCSAQHPCSNPALRAAAAEGSALCSRFFAPAPLQNETIDYNKKDTHRTALFPNPAPARSAVKRTASVTTGHHLYNVLTTCAAREEERLPASLLQKPSFSSPPCTALFFFSAHGEKEEGGASPTNEMWVHFPTKEWYSRKRKPTSQKALLPKRSPGKHAGRAPRGISCPIRGQSPPGGRKARPAGRYFFPSSVFTRSVAAWNTCSALWCTPG